MFFFVTYKLEIHFIPTPSLTSQPSLARESIPVLFPDRAAADLGTLSERFHPCTSYPRDFTYRRSAVVNWSTARTGDDDDRVTVALRRPGQHGCGREGEQRGEGRTSLEGRQQRHRRGRRLVPLVVPLGHEPIVVCVAGAAHTRNFVYRPSRDPD